LLKALDIPNVLYSLDPWTTCPVTSDMRILSNFLNLGYFDYMFIFIERENLTHVYVDKYINDFFIHNFFDTSINEV